MKRHTLKCQSSTEVFGNMDQSFPKKFSCTTCKKLFSSFQLLADHKERFHDGHDQTWTCEHCGKNFLNKQNFRQHLLYCHRPQIDDNVDESDNVDRNDANVDRNTDNVDRNNDDDVNEEPTLGNDWICGVCHRSFTAPQTLKVHLKSAHEMMANFSCLICRKLFCFHRNLSVHNRRNHDEKKWKCDICPSSTFRQAHHLKRHKRLCHKSDAL